MCSPVFSAGSKHVEIENRGEHEVRPYILFPVPSMSMRNAVAAVVDIRLYPCDCGSVARNSCTRALKLSGWVMNGACPHPAMILSVAVGSRCAI